MDKIFSIVYIISAVLLIVCFYRIKKADLQLNGICFSFICLFEFMCYQTAVALMLKIFHIPIGKTAFAIINFAVGIFWDI